MGHKENFRPRAGSDGPMLNIEQVRDYRNWIGQTPVNIRQAGPG
jgi:hypothetical protein